jgi:hypothetical protein
VVLPPEREEPPLEFWLPAELKVWLPELKLFPPLLLLRELGVEWLPELRDEPPLELRLLPELELRLPAPELWLLVELELCEE